MTSPIKRLPAPAQHIREAYRQLVAEIDELARELATTRFPNVLQCRPGCDECCMCFSVLPLEAAILAEAMKDVQLPKHGNTEKCVLLSGGLCQVYTARPIICRTQGLPLGYVDEFAGTIEVSACPLNFTDDYSFGEDDLLYMDDFNRRFVKLNHEYCRCVGLDPGGRIPLAGFYQNK
ncbi:Putative zinc-or iron-chelating domain-containing protein [Desulfopila aestuarii DSM 18488]|uniref:Putative zinc-or iron-chelating domain-containing protein n=2 Tax=Desulfopila aestuarii TaxID=231440 RepID=A0A1M7XVE7_9BACT|nr:Putative zinc-or iron-chelating domain-containing protein [Desulfopila aestuarii DSM 18488]